jgi:hypothetical protein
VVHTDGKGVSMVTPSPITLPVRLGNGQKQGKLKEPVVTGLYTIAPNGCPPGFVLFRANG